ncbi:hypothetical protein AB0758_00275 [Tolypothrix bouteillei VB521301_2]|uniref:hypothetical protein n=1 Tax=Tolypothrix bouteillei TaxID=1246981 RepID=UPI000512DD01
MCYFITAALPKDTDLKSASALFEQFKLGFEIIDNPHIKAQLPLGEYYVLTTRSQCDCGTVLGSLYCETSSKLLADSSEIQKLKKKGWSEGKIQRWISEKEKIWEKNERMVQGNLERGKAEASVWLEFLTSVLESIPTKRISLLLHWYKRGIANERIGFKRVVTQPISEVNAEYLLKIEQDVLYSFVGK